MLFTKILPILFKKDSIKGLSHLYSILRKDPYFSIYKLYRSLRLFDSEKIVEHNNMFILSSFLPPFPSKPFFRIFENGIHEDLPFYDFARALRRAPISIHLSITNRCMYNCKHCCNKFKEINDLSTSQLIDLVKEIQDLGVSVIGITGGEPLLRKDLPEILSNIDDRSIVILLTTGYGFDIEKAKELKKSGLFATLISIDSAFEDKHDENRGFKGAFRIAADALKISRKIGLYTMIGTVATNENIENGDMVEIFRLGRKLGVHEIRVVDMTPAGNLIHAQPDELISNESRMKLRDLHVLYNKKKVYPKISTFSYIEGGTAIGCPAGSFHGYIDAEGNLYPCDLVPISFGNIKDRPLRELWREMNDTIKYPKRSCFAMENHDIIEEAFKGNFPLDKSVIDKIKDKEWFEEKSDFFKILLGER